MEELGSHDVIEVPAAQGVCSTCRGPLFAVVRVFLERTGEPVEEGVHVGCVECEAEVGGAVARQIRAWVAVNYRVRA